MKVCGIVNFEDFNGLRRNSLLFHADQRLVVNVKAFFILIECTRLVVREFLVCLILFVLILSAVSGKASKDISKSIGVSAIRTILILFKFIFYSIIPI
jgi:hypothetical protein